MSDVGQIRTNFLKKTIKYKEGNFQGCQLQRENWPGKEIRTQHGSAKQWIITQLYYDYVIQQKDNVFSFGNEIY